jgi:hypothetical protein
MRFVITPEEWERIERESYEARWGHDGQGSVGCKLSFERWKADEKARIRELQKPCLKPPDDRPLFEQVRRHKKGHGWKQMHES